MFRSIPELKMQNPSMSDVQIRQFLLYDSAHAFEFVCAIGYPVERALVLSCFSFELFTFHIQIELSHFSFNTDCQPFQYHLAFFLISALQHGH